MLTFGIFKSFLFNDKNLSKTDEIYQSLFIRHYRGPVCIVLKRFLMKTRFVSKMNIGANFLWNFWRVVILKRQNDALWSGTNKYRDVSTEPLARPFARLLPPLTHSLALDCSLCSRPPLRSLIRSLAHFAHSIARGTVNDWMAIMSVFFSIFDHSAPTTDRQKDRRVYPGKTERQRN